jgi:hypothetical protein
MKALRKITTAKSLVGSFFAVALIAWSPLQARADTIALSSFTGAETFNLRVDFTFGWGFTLSSLLLVTQLGLWDQDNNGLNASHVVTMWTSTGMQQAQVTIPSGTGATLTNGFRFVSIPSVLLPAGSYTIGGSYSAVSDITAFQASTITTASGVTYNGSKSLVGFGFPAGDVFDFPNSYFGPNFQFTTGVSTPDSGSTVSLLGCALPGLATLRRKLRC